MLSVCQNENTNIEIKNQHFFPGYFKIYQQIQKTLTEFNKKIIEKTNTYTYGKQQNCLFLRENELVNFYQT